jgi:hypothetical protein
VRECGARPQADASAIRSASALTKEPSLRTLFNLAETLDAKPSEIVRRAEQPK